MVLKKLSGFLALLLSLAAGAQTGGWPAGFAPAGSAGNRSVLDASPPIVNAPGMNAPGMNAPGAAPAGGAAPADVRLLQAPPRPAPNQFQRFVQESTGRLLPVYGTELFQTPQAYAADSGLSPPADYVLGVGDEVRIQVWGAIDYVGSHVIDRSGQVSLPRVGVVSLAGVPLRDLESVLRAQIGRVFVKFNLSATMGKLRAVQVYVVGQAQQPGTYQLSSLSTLLNAVFASGGPNANGSMRNIQLRRGGHTVT